jgi:superfamily II DNA or RNA helicase
MKVSLKGRLLYFDEVSNYELDMLKALLNREDKKSERKVEMLFYNENEGKYYTYFGYLKLIIDRIGNVFYTKPRRELKIFDREKIKNVGNFILRDYQIKVVENCLREKFGTVVAPTGSGKTVIMLSLINYLDLPTLIVQPTKQLVEQFYKKMVDSGAFNEEEIGLLYGEKKEVKKITIGTFQTIKSYIEQYPDLMKDFKLLLYDESSTTQQATTGRYIDEFYKDKVEYVIGFTATPYRYKDIDNSIEDFIMLGLTGKPIAQIPLMFLVKKGYLAKPYVYFERINAPAAKIKNWHTVYRNYIENFERRNLKIAEWITKFYRNNIKVMSLVVTKKHARNVFNLLPEDVKKEAIIVFGNNQGMIYDYGDLRYTYIDYNDLLYKVENGIDYKVVIATQIFNQGTDLPSLGALIMAFGGKSNVQIFQKLGRVLRLSENKDKTFIIDFFDDTHPYLRNHSYKRIKSYQEEGIPIITDRMELEEMIKEESLLKGGN